MNDRVRKYSLPSNRQSPGVIGVNVDYENIGDLFRGIACVLQAAGELEKLRTEESSGPSVHENQAIPQLDEERVHRRLDGRLDIGPVEELFRLARLHVGP